MTGKFILRCHRHRHGRWPNLPGFTRIEGVAENRCEFVKSRPGGGVATKFFLQGFKADDDPALPFHFRLTLCGGHARAFHLKPLGGVITATEFDDVAAHFAQHPPLFRAFGFGEAAQMAADETAAIHVVRAVSLS